jgi:hypothetical protein
LKVDAIFIYLFSKFTFNNADSLSSTHVLSVMWDFVGNEFGDTCMAMIGQSLKGCPNLRWVAVDKTNNPGVESRRAFVALATLSRRVTIINSVYGQ